MAKSQRAISFCLSIRSPCSCCSLIIMLVMLSYVDTTRTNLNKTNNNESEKLEVHSLRHVHHSKWSWNNMHFRIDGIIAKIQLSSTLEGEQGCDCSGWTRSLNSLEYELILIERAHDWVDMAIAAPCALKILWNVQRRHRVIPIVELPGRVDFFMSHMLHFILWMLRLFDEISAHLGQSFEWHFFRFSLVSRSNCWHPLFAKISREIKFHESLHYIPIRWTKYPWKLHRRLSPISRKKNAKYASHLFIAAYKRL